MMVTVHVSELGRGRWYEYASRFLIGGLVTAGAGLIAKEFGPSVGGLFLAIPAIFPASMTLIEKHERKKKEQHALTGLRRGREAAAVDAAGASLGSCGLFVFAVVVWKFLTAHSPWRGFCSGLAAFKTLPGIEDHPAPSRPQLANTSAPFPTPLAFERRAVCCVRYVL